MKLIKIVLKILNFASKIRTICLSLLFSLLFLLQDIEANIYNRQGNNEKSRIGNKDTFGYDCKVSKNANKKQFFCLKIF